MDKPTKIPENGFYYHYKHDPAGAINNYAYEVIGLGLHTEERNYTVLYRPLYKNNFLAPANYCSRPYSMFMETIDKDGRIIPRFQKIEDAEKRRCIFIKVDDGSLVDTLVSTDQNGILNGCRLLL